jgi:hypothetical protein
MIYWNVQKIVNNAVEEALWSLQRRRVVPDAVPDAIVELVPDEKPKKAKTKSHKKT